MKRSRDMIIAQILEICTNGVSKTRIVYQANLNFRTINPYLDLLMRNGLIDVRKEQTLIYETTPRGLSLLNNFRQIHSELSSAEDIMDSKGPTKGEEKASQPAI